MCVLCPLSKKEEAAWRAAPGSPRGDTLYFEADCLAHKGWWWLYFGPIPFTSFFIIFWPYISLFKVLWLISQLFIFWSGFVYLISSSHIQTFIPFCFKSIYCKYQIVKSQKKVQPKSLCIPVVNLIVNFFFGQLGTIILYLISTFCPSVYFFVPTIYNIFLLFCFPL